MITEHEFNWLEAHIDRLTFCKTEVGVLVTWVEQLDGEVTTVGWNCCDLASAIRKAREEFPT